MDLNDLRSGVTLVSLLLFVALLAHTWSRKRSTEHEHAAQLPFMDEAAGTETRGEQS
jgi:cytochrome c oxidase cbb3-type subunit IV